MTGQEAMDTSCSKEISSKTQGKMQLVQSKNGVTCVTSTLGGL